MANKFRTGFLLAAVTPLFGLAAYGIESGITTWTGANSNDWADADNWTTVPVPDTDGQTVVADVTFNIAPGDPLNTVTATIFSFANGGKLFARCSATEQETRPQDRRQP